MKKGLRRLKGLIIHRSSVREKDRIIEAYTLEEGRVSFFAPGVRHIASRRAGHLETFMETNLILSSGSRGSSLSEARVSRAFPNLRTSYEKIEVIYEIVKMLRNYTGEGQGNKILYDTLLSCVTISDQKENPPGYLREIMAVRLLRFLGALPDLYYCSSCRKRLKENDFSLRGADRGFWCGACGGEKDAQLTDVLKMMRIIINGKENIFNLKISDTVSGRLRRITQALLRGQGHVAKQ